MSMLFTPIRLRDLEIRNRIFVSPMCQYSATDGMPGSWHAVHLGSRAVGGAGLVMVEATAVTPAGRITPYCTGLWSDAQRDAFAPIARFIREQGAIPAIQLAHAGRKASTDAPWRGGGPLSREQNGWQPLSPGMIPFTPKHVVPHALTTTEIDALVTAFADAARRARVAGFDVVELHCAHGYLLHEFLSPLTNRRTDQYGGSLDNRMRLPLEVVRTVRQIWPAHLPVFVRLSVSDWVDGGWDLPQSIEFSKQLKLLGVDLVDCSSGGLTADAKIPAAPGYQVPFAAAIRRDAGIATGAVGLITEAHQAEAIVAGGQADTVLLARAMLRDPYWPLHAASTLGVDVPWPNQYLRAKP
jgi:2,4-dienoyl-CoA reductase-like NADH-dependent reductase (Old Yellow Enzyme family)